MKTIEEIKIELTLKMLSGELSRHHFLNLPKTKELRTFACSLGPKYARWYAIHVDKRRYKETDKAIQKDPDQWKSYWIEMEFC